MSELTKNQQAVLNDIKSSMGIERVLMCKDERKVAGQLIELGLVYKGRSDTKQGLVKYFAW